LLLSHFVGRFLPNLTCVDKDDTVESRKYHPVGIDLHIAAGELVLVSGPVACGKSTLLQSLVGNTEQLGGKLEVPASVAFQPQSPILFDQTIRANILFGISDAATDEAALQEALVSSTLSMDMDDPESTLHEKREQTGCGQGGSELSGGQQARVALARCMYAALAGGSEAVILDGGLSLVDTHPVTVALLRSFASTCRWLTCAIGLCNAKQA